MGVGLRGHRVEKEGGPVTGWVGGGLWSPWGERWG